MISERQEKLLDFLIREYIATAEPVSSLALKKIINLDVCGATIRNDLQALTEEGYIKQPHTSAGRIPTEKAYKHFAERIKKQRENEFENFIFRQIKFAHEEMAKEMEMMQELMHNLENDNLFEILTTIEIWHKKNQN
ncbi:MAG: DeoR family transcriptional regulator [Candidatus Staskawiczbacteria bacterium]|nr:DeoR family transcriptional regulator [Candidatus Staskawiczbacteria bacterium]